MKDGLNSTQRRAGQQMTCVLCAERRSIMESTITELARFLSISQDEARNRVESYHPRQLAEDWNRIKPKTPEEVNDFYAKSADLYLYELVSWNSSTTYYQRIEPLLHYHNRKILEIGAGNGSLCIALALNNNDVTYCEINESLFEFAKQRFNDRFLPIKMVKNLGGLDKDYDIVAAIDVLEHIHPDSLSSLLKNISGCLKDRGFFYHRSNFGQQDLFPMHFDHSEGIKELLKASGLRRRENGDWVKGGEDSGVQISVPIVGGRHISQLTHDLINMVTPPGTAFVKVDNESAVDRARNRLVESLTQSWLFFADADQSFPPEVLERLMSWNVDIVSGVVFKRTQEPMPMVYRYDHKKEEGAEGYYYAPMLTEIKNYLAQYSEILSKSPPAVCLPRTSLIECDGVGCGCLLINKRVFDTLEKPYFQCSESKNNGEDFYFCRKAQLAGFKIYCDPSVLCGHYGEYWRGHKHFMSFALNKPFPWKDEL